MSLSKDSLKKLYLELDQEMRESFERSLPLEEYILDRFERAQALSAGEKTSIHHLSYIYGKVKIGKDTWVGPMTLIDGSGGLEIGDNCSISAGVHIYTHDTVKKRMSTGKLAGEKASVKIGSSCYLGPQSLIGRGVELGDFCIVGANSFVNKSFPAFSVVMGTPATLRGQVKFQDSGDPYIEWNSEKSLEQKIKNLEAKIQKLELRMQSIEKA